MPPRVARLAGLGALGAAGGLFVLILLLVFATRPGPYAGMDETTRVLTWLCIAGLLAALAFVHVLLGRRLLSLSRGERPAP